MGYTLAEKIIMKHTGDTHLAPGDGVEFCRIGGELEDVFEGKQRRREISCTPQENMI